MDQNKPAIRGRGRLPRYSGAPESALPSSINAPQPQLLGLDQILGSVGPRQPSVRPNLPRSTPTVKTI